jgi:hypothetical protein
VGDFVTDGFNVEVIVVGEAEIIAVGVVAELGAQDAKATINSHDKKTILCKSIS